MLNWKTVILVIVSLAIGFYLNTLANNIANKKLLEQLKAELALLKSSRLKNTDKEVALQAQINLIESK